MVESSDELAGKWLHSVALRRKDCDLTSTMFQLNCKFNCSVERCFCKNFVVHSCLHSFGLISFASCRQHKRLLVVITAELASCRVTVCAGLVLGLLREMDVIAGRQSDDDMSIALSGDVFVPKSRALSYLRASKRTVYDYDDGWDDNAGGGQRGLACECCVHMCTYDEMIEYCGQPTLRKRLDLSVNQ